nr:DUF4118 domain-containing protein [Actinotalea solisilvae]
MTTWAPDIDPARRAVPGVRRRGALSRRRTVAGWLLATLGPAALTAALLRERDVLGLPTDLMMFFTLVVVTALVGGLAPSLVCAVLAASLLNYFFTEPTGGLTIDDPENALALMVFALVAGAVASVVGLAERRRADAREARAEATALADLSRAVLAGRDSPEGVAEELARRFGSARALVLTRSAEPGGWATAASYPPGAPAGSDVAGARDVPQRAAGDVLLALPGHRLTAAEERVLTAFAEQAAVVLDRARLRREAERARELEHLDAARTAILAAVSHDLRTPLAAVRAAVDGLGAHGPVLDADDRAVLVEAIDTGTARLERLIDDLLDLSRLRMGAVRPHVEAVSLEEVIPRALEGVDPRRVVLDLPDDLPLVLTDPACSSASSPTSRPTRRSTPPPPSRRGSPRPCAAGRWWSPWWTVDPASGATRSSARSRRSSAWARPRARPARVSGWGSRSSAGSPTRSVRTSRCSRRRAAGSPSRSRCRWRSRR